MGNMLSGITNYLWTQSWQIAVLAVIIAAVSLVLKNKSAHVRYLLWMIVLAKCLIPPLVTIPLAILPEGRGLEPVLTSPVEMPAVTIEAVDTAESDSAIALPLVPVARPTIVEKLAQVTVHQWVVFVWITGAGLFALIAVIKAFRVNRWLSRERKLLSVELQSEIEELLAGLGIEPFPRVWLVDDIGQPFVWGLVRGSIYLPADFAGVDSAEHRRGVLGHELSHILRFDAAVNLLQIVAQGVFWFHPFVWWANREIRAEREKCCDEMAIARFGTAAKDYSRAIVDTLLVERKSAIPVPSLAVAGPVKNIEDRIKTIMESGKRFYKRPSLIAVIVVLVLAGIAVPTSIALTARSKSEIGSASVEGDKRDASKSGTKLVQLTSVQPEAVTLEGLAGICEAMESAFRDISVEYEWYVEPPLTLEDIRGTGLLMNKGRMKFALSVGRPLPDRVLLEESDTIMNQYGRTWDSFRRTSYNGKVVKCLQIERQLHTGFITDNKSSVPPLILSPVGFSILRCSLDSVTDGVPLSAMLMRREFARIDNTVGKINGFNTIRAELLTILKEHVYFRIYFAIEQGYTPVRYEFVSGGKTNGIIDVQSLQKVAEGLWFPSSGVIRTPGKRDMNGFEVIGKVAVNQGLTDEYFDIDFPAGTEVDDRIRDVEYIVKPTKQQQEKLDREAKYREEHADEMAAAREEGGRIYSAIRMRKLGGAKGFYMMDNDKKYPQTLVELKPYINDEEIFAWIVENVEYLGKGKTAEDPLDAVLAYDKTLLEKGEGTNVLFNDCYVRFERLDQLGDLGIKLSERIESAEKLSDLGKALLLYANDHYANDPEAKYPGTLEQLKPYIRDRQDFQWILENVTYSGKSKSLVVSPYVVIAYDKALLEKDEGTNVLFNGGHVRFEKPERFEKLGVKLSEEVKAEIRIEARFLFVSVDANGIKDFFEEEKLEFPSGAEEPNYTSVLNTEQADRLLELTQASAGSKILAAPNIVVSDGESATLRTQRTIRYEYIDPNATSTQPEQKELLIGTMIQVVPTLQADGREILLELEFEHINFLGFEDGLPQTEITRIRSRVVVPDGQTLLLGGQKITDEDEQDVLKMLLFLVKAEKVEQKSETQF